MSGSTPKIESESWPGPKEPGGGITIYRGLLAHSVGDPFLGEDSLFFVEDGALAFDANGRICRVGAAAEIQKAYPGGRLLGNPSVWLIPGLIDGHAHYPQVYATAAYGSDLLDWLQRSVFPAEAAFHDEGFAAHAARDFVGQILASGTTTAMVFGSQFEGANRALFRAAKRAGLRLIAGMTMMDRFAPDELLHTPQAAHDQVCRLIAECEGEPRLGYAITPRFALSCSPAMLEVCGALHARFPHCHVQTHLNENLEEIRQTAAHFPAAAHYLDVYAKAGLMGPKTVFAHGVFTSPAELEDLAASGSAVCHCPISNDYLGSGHFSLAAHLAKRIPVLMGTDIGAGTSFSIWDGLSRAYQVQQAHGMSLNAAQLLFLGTLGGARALGLGQETGNFEVGKSADFFVLDPTRDPTLARRLGHCTSLEDQLFALVHLAKPSCMRATFAAGTMVYAAPS